MPGNFRTTLEVEHENYLKGDRNTTRHGWRNAITLVDRGSMECKRRRPALGPPAAERAVQHFHQGLLVHSGLHPSPKVNGPWHSVCENPSKGATDVGRLHPTYRCVLPSAKSPPSFVLSPPVLKWSLTADGNGEVARGFG